jgi:hypothetical protein
MTENTMTLEQVLSMAAKALHKSKPLPEIERCQPNAMAEHERAYQAVMAHLSRTVSVSDEDADRSLNAAVVEGLSVRHYFPGRYTDDLLLMIMRAALEADRAGRGDLSDNDELMCCNGVDCGCQGLTKGKYRAALLTQSHSCDDSASFKNFHRMLCDRFGYTHDEIDWRRDQVSLCEHIAKMLAQGNGGVPLSIPVPVSIDRTHANRAYVTLGFSDASFCTDFIKAAQRGFAPQPDAEGG